MRTFPIIIGLSLLGSALWATPAAPGAQTSFVPVYSPSSTQYMIVVSLAVDFNNDGKLDLLGYGEGDQFAAVALGNGDGTFQSPLPFQPCAGGGCQVEGVAAGDFNKDGCPDVVAVVEGSAASISVVLGKCNGEFGTFQSYPAADLAAYGLQVGDFNGDGNLDIAVFCADNTSNTFLEVLLGNGDGTFQAPLNLPLKTNFISQTAIGDFNGDGYPDLIVAAGGPVYLLLGNGDGSFAAPVTVATLDSTYSIAAADFNQDGILDLAVYAGSSVAILLGQGGGTFSPPVSYAAGHGYGNLMAGDFNGDGKIDLVVATLDIMFLAGNGDGTFVEPAPPSPPLIAYQYPASVAGDFTGNGSLDLGSPGITYLQSVAKLSTYNMEFHPTLLGKASKVENVTITNVGTSPLTISQAQVTGTDATNFPIASDTCLGNPVKPGGTCAIGLQLKPLTAAYFRAVLQISINGMPSPASVSLQGGATALQLTPAKLDFGSVKVRTVSKPQVVTLTNVTDSPADVYQVFTRGKDRGDFILSSHCGQIAPQATCEIKVQFIPTKKGARTAGLVVNANYLLSKSTVLTGTGM